MACRPEGKDALLGAALFLVAAGTTERRIEPAGIECLTKPLRLPHVGMQRTMVERIDSHRLGFGILVDD